MSNLAIFVATGYSLDSSDCCFQNYSIFWAGAGFPLRWAKLASQLQKFVAKFPMQQLMSFVSLWSVRKNRRQNACYGQILYLDNCHLLIRCPMDKWFHNRSCAMGTETSWFGLFSISLHCLKEFRTSNLSHTLAHTSSQFGYTSPLLNS